MCIAWHGERGEAGVGVMPGGRQLGEGSLQRRRRWGEPWGKTGLGDAFEARRKAARRGEARQQGEERHCVCMCPLGSSVVRRPWAPVLAAPERCVAPLAPWLPSRDDVRIACFSSHGLHQVISRGVSGVYASLVGHGVRVWREGRGRAM